MNRTNIMSIIIIVLLILLLKTCDIPNTTSVIKETIVHDTTLITKDSLIYIKKPNIIKHDTLPIALWDTQYLPDTSYEKLRLQYLENTKELLSTNIYRDSVAYDSNNYVILSDTLQLNKLQGRDVFFHLTDKTITTTITKYPKPKSQLYLGVGLLGNRQDYINGAEINLTLKTKQDKMWDIKYQFNNNQQSFGIGYKWKL